MKKLFFLLCSIFSLICVSAEAVNVDYVYNQAPRVVTLQGIRIKPLHQWIQASIVLPQYALEKYHSQFVDEVSIQEEALTLVIHGATKVTWKVWGYYYGNCLIIVGYRATEPDEQSYEEKKVRLLRVIELGKTEALNLLVTPHNELVISAGKLSA